MLIFCLQACVDVLWLPLFLFYLLSVPRCYYTTMAAVLYRLAVAILAYFSTRRRSLAEPLYQLAPGGRFGGARRWPLFLPLSLIFM